MVANILSEFESLHIVLQDSSHDIIIVMLEHTPTAKIWNIWKAQEKHLTLRFIDTTDYYQQT